MSFCIYSQCQSHHHQLSSSSELALKAITFPSNNDLIVCSKCCYGQVYNWLCYIAGEDNAIPAHVINDWAVSRTFQILYRNEDIPINDVILYRFHTLINSNKVSKSRICLQHKQQKQSVHMNFRFLLNLSLYMCKDHSKESCGLPRTASLWHKGKH